MSVMRIPLHVSYLDGTEVDVEALPLELMAFERAYNMPMTVFGNPNQQRLEYLLFLGHAALKRTGEERSLEEWAATVAEVGGVDEEPDGSDPLDQSPSTGS